MIVKMRSKFIRQAIEVEDREAAGKRVVTPMEEGRSLGFNLRSQGRSAEGVEMGLTPLWKRSCDLRRYPRGILIRDQASNDAPRGLQVRPKVDTLVKAWANTDSVKSHFQLVRVYHSLAQFVI
jgi:hypothetical protein